MAGQESFFPLSVFRCISALVHHTSGGFCVCVLFWDEVLLPDELRAVSVSLVTAYRTCVDCQRPPVDAASRGVHRQTVQQLGHHLQTCLWLIDILSSYTPWPKYTKALSPYLISIMWSLKERYLNEKQPVYLKFKAPGCTTGAWWDIIIWRDVLRRDPQRRAPSIVTHHLNVTTALDGHRHLICCIYWYIQVYMYIFIITWWGSGAIFFLNRWNTLLSSVSCIAISSRSVSTRAAGEKNKSNMRQANHIEI